MIEKKALIHVAIIAMLALTGCATVIRGPNVAFKVATDPVGAQVKTDLLTRKSKRDHDAQSGEPLEYRGCSPTPCEFQVSRRSEFTATVTMEGYHDASVEITSGIGSGGSGASATGGIIVTGAAYSTVYGLASFWPMVFQTSTNAGAAASATQAATGVGLVFVGVDVLSGAMLAVRPNPVVLIMIPEEESIPTLRPKKNYKNS
jgi:hypothetical protein